MSARDRGRQPRQGIGSAIAGVALMAALALVVAAPAAAKTRLGFNDDRQHVAAAGNLIERSNADVLRTPLYWPELQPEPGRWDFRESDAIYERLLAAGVTPLFPVYGTPDHVLDLPLVAVQPGFGSGPRDPGRWRRLWRELAERYPRAVLQVWNEPNIWHYGLIGPERMAEVTNQAAAAVHEVSPGTRVLGPPAAPNDDWRDYMARVYARTGPGVEVAAHIYPRVPRNWRRDFRSDLRFARRVADGRRLWITETGLSRTQYGRKRQRRGTRWIVRRARRAKAASLIVHRLVPRQGAGRWDRGLAVTNSRLRPLPVFRDLARLAGRSRSQ